MSVEDCVNMAFGRQREGGKRRKKMRRGQTAQFAVHAMTLAQEERSKGPKGRRLLVFRGPRQMKLGAYKADLLEVQAYCERKIIRKLRDAVYSSCGGADGATDKISWAKLTWLPQVRMGKVLMKLFDIYGGVVVFYPGINPDFLKRFPVGYEMQGEEIPV
jgi:hypothetical protein